MLVFDSKTPQELLRDVAVYLRQLATQHQKSMARNKTETAFNTARANALIVAAMGLEGAKIIPAQSDSIPRPIDAPCDRCGSLLPIVAVLIADPDQHVCSACHSDPHIPTRADY